jgi:hypothetical protein
MRTICFIDSERYFAYHTLYDRDTNHASVQFLLLISCCGVSVRPICVCVSSFRAIFFIISTSIRNNPSTFFQNTYTGFVRIILIRYTTASCRDTVAILSRYGTLPCCKVRCCTSAFAYSIKASVAYAPPRDLAG